MIATTRPDDDPRHRPDTATDRRRLLQMCVAAAAAGLAGGWTGAATAASPDAAPLAPGQRALIAALADTILPATDTPGAAGAGVPDFIALMVDSWFDADERARFVAGLDGLGARARAIAGRPFETLSPEARLRFLTAVQAEATRARHKGAPVPFFLSFKRLTVFGYYTSEVGASQELTMNLVPGEYQPCAALDHTQHAFSLGRGSPVFPIFDDPVSY